MAVGVVMAGAKSCLCSGRGQLLAVSLGGALRRLLLLHPGDWEESGNAVIEEDSRTRCWLKTAAWGALEHSCQRAGGMNGQGGVPIKCICVLGTLCALTGAGRSAQHGQPCGPT